MSLAPSPTAARVVEILDYLAQRPTDAFTTSQLARALEQNRTTCQAALLSLEAAGWVRRDPDKAYSLVDCMSMELMRQRGITHALTNDHHFAQEKFTVVSE